MKRIAKTALYLALGVSVAFAANHYWPEFEFMLAPELDGVYLADGVQAAADCGEPPGDAPPPALNFIIVGDTGTGGPGQRRVAESMSGYAERERSEFVLLVGDNFYSSGVESTADPQWVSKFENMYRGHLRHLPFYAALGNHDHEGNAQAQVDYSKLSGRWTMPSRYYAFTRPLPDLGDLEIFVLDTNPIVDAEGDWEAQLAWLEIAISSSDARWKIVAGHHPLRSGGRPKNSTAALRRALLPIFERAPVDLYLCGHDHYLEYGATDAGVEYAISGAGGKLQSKVIRHAQARFATSQLGFLAIFARGDQLLLQFVSASGQKVFETPIRKDGSPVERVAPK